MGSGRRVVIYWEAGVFVHEVITPFNLSTGFLQDRSPDFDNVFRSRSLLKIDRWNSKLILSGSWEAVVRLGDGCACYNPHVATEAAIFNVEVNKIGNGR
jgi:hypothetical protein